MINWDLFSPRNLFMIAVLALIALMAYKHFAGNTPVAAPVVAQ